MLLFLISHLTIGYRNPLVYDLLYGKYTMDYRYWYFSLNYSSYQINSAPVALTFPHEGILPPDAALHTDLLIKDLGGITRASIGYRVEDMAIEFTYFGNEELSLESFDEYGPGSCDTLDMVFGQVEDTIYPGEIRNLDRSIRVIYNLDSLYRTYYTSSKSSGGIRARPLSFKFIKGDWFLHLQYRKVEGGGTINYDTRMFILTPAVRVEPQDADVVWYALITGIPVVPSPFLFQREYSINSRSHWVISAGYRKGNLLLELGFSPSLKVEGTITDVLKYLVSLGDSATSTRLDTVGWNDLYAYTNDNGELQIEGTGVIYVDYAYRDTTIDTTVAFSYEIPASPIVKLIYRREFGKADGTIFFTYNALNNLAAGFSIEYPLVPRFALSTSWVYSRNTWFQYGSAGLNAIIYSGKMRLTFGLATNLTGDIYRAVQDIMGARMSMEGSIKPHFSINFSMVYQD